MRSLQARLSAAFVFVALTLMAAFPSLVEAGIRRPGP